MTRKSHTPNEKVGKRGVIHSQRQKREKAIILRMILFCGWQWCVVNEIYLMKIFFSEKKNHANGKIIVPVLCKVATCDAPAADCRMQKGNTRIVNHNDFAYGGCHIVSFYEKESAHQAFDPQRQTVS